MATVTFREDPPLCSAPALCAEPLDDGQLLNRFIRCNDGEAFEELVRRHGPMVLGVCRRVLDSSHDAEDCLQAVFMVLVRKAATVQPASMVGNWLYGVAYRTALEAKKIAARRKNRERKRCEMPRPETHEDRWEELRPLLDQELNKLPDKYRFVLIACDLEGRTRREVAEALGLPDGTVASRLARARAILTRRLAKRNLAISTPVLVSLLAHHATAEDIAPSLAAATAQAATQLAAGKPMAGIVSGKVAALTDCVISSLLWWTKLKVASSVLAVLALIGFCIGVLLPSATADRQPEKAEVKPVDQIKPELIADCVLQRVDPDGKTVVATRATEIDGATEVLNIHVAPGAKIMVGGVESKLIDLQIGMTINIECRRNAAGNREALRIEVTGQAGVILAMNQQSVTIRSENKQGAVEKTYDLEEGALVTIDGKKAKIGDLKPKMSVVVKSPVGKTKAVGIKAAGPKVSGSVKSVSVDKKTVSVAIKDTHLVAEAITVAVDADVVVNGKQATLGELQAGMRVTLQMSAASDQSVVIGITSADRK